MTPGKALVGHFYKKKTKYPDGVFANSYWWNTVSIWVVACLVLRTLMRAILANCWLVNYRENSNTLDCSKCTITAKTYINSLWRNIRLIYVHIYLYAYMGLIIGLFVDSPTTNNVCWQIRRIVRFIVYGEKNPDIFISAWSVSLFISEGM